MAPILNQGSCLDTDHGNDQKQFPMVDTLVSGEQGQQSLIWCAPIVPYLLGLSLGLGQTSMILAFALYLIVGLTGFARMLRQKGRYQNSVLWAIDIGLLLGAIIGMGFTVAYWTQLLPFTG